MTMERNPSKYTVKVFDPSKEPSIPEQVKAEQAKDPTITGLSCATRMGLIETPKGTFCLDVDGVGGRRPIEKTNVEIAFFWERADGFDVVPCAFAKYSLADCKACLTGEEMPLHEFIRVFGARLDANYWEWERDLDKIIGVAP